MKMDEKSEMGSWLRSKTFLSVFGAFFAILLIILLAIINITNYIEEIEEKLQYVPPQMTGPALTVESVVAGQTVYVPVYSHIYVQAGRPFLLETTLSVRNTDPDETIQVTSVRYYDTNGKQVETFVEKPLQLNPLATIEFLVPQQKTEGGSGANFMVEWVSDTKVSKPIIEAVMVGLEEKKAVSIVRPGYVISK